MKEIDLQNEIRIALSKIGVITFRMNVGFFETKDGRKIKAGTIGMSDLLVIKIVKEVI